MMEQIKPVLYIERKKEIEDLIDWLETQYVLINTLIGKDHKVVRVEQDYWDRINYVINDDLAVEVGIYHCEEDVPRVSQWNYYVDIYDSNMITKCENLGIECINIFVDSLHDVYRTLEVAFKYE